MYRVQIWFGKGGYLDGPFVDLDALFSYLKNLERDGLVLHKCQIDNAH